MQNVPEGYVLAEKGFTPIKAVEAGAACLRLLEVTSINNPGVIAAAVFQDMLLAIEKDQPDCNNGKNCEPVWRPCGAAHNGRVLLDRLENEYSFDCEAGPLRDCVDWHDLRSCFNVLSEYAEQAAAGQEPEDHWIECAQRVKRIRADLEGFDGDRRGMISALEDAERDLIKAILSGIKPPSKGGQ